MENSRVGPKLWLILDEQNSPDGTPPKSRFVWVNLANAFKPQLSTYPGLDGLACNYLTLPDGQRIITVGHDGKGYGKDGRVSLAKINSRQSKSRIFVPISNVYQSEKIPEQSR